MISDLEATLLLHLRSPSVLSDLSPNLQTWNEPDTNVNTSLSSIYEDPDSPLNEWIQIRHGDSAKDDMWLQEVWRTRKGTWHLEDTEVLDVLHKYKRWIWREVNKASTVQLHWTPGHPSLGAGLPGRRIQMKALMKAREVFKELHPQ